MRAQHKPILHARDHMPGGADPIPPILPTGTFLEVVAATFPGAYYKMNEASGGWADSSGAGRDMTYVSRAGTSRAHLAALDEGDDAKAVQVHGPSPVAALSASNVGQVTDSFFEFAGHADFTVSALVNLEAIPTGTFSMGICGNIDVGGGSYPGGWGLYVLSEAADPDPGPGGAEGGKPCFRRQFGALPMEAHSDVALPTGAWVRLTAIYAHELPHDPAPVPQVQLWGDDELLGVSNPTTDPDPSLPSGGSHLTFRVGDCGIEEGFGGNMAPFYGLIDSVLVWDRALSPDEVYAIIAAYNEGLVPVSDGEGGVTWGKPTVEVEF